MMEYGKEEFYLQELKRVYGEFENLQKQIDDLSEIRRKKGKLIKNLMNVLKLTHGENATKQILKEHGLTALTDEIFAEQKSPTLVEPTVYRRRRGEVKPVEPENILKKGSRIKMLSGYYKGCSGYISSYQTSDGKRGLDVTYYITLKDQTGTLRRTSTKHNALGKSFVPIT